MFNNDYIAYALIAVGIFTLYMAVVNLFRYKGNQRVKNVSDSATYVLDNGEDDNAADSAFPEFCEKFLPKQKDDVAIRKDIAKKMVMAGLTSPNGPTYFLFFKRVIQPVFLLLGLWISYSAISNGTSATDVLPPLIFGLVILIIGLNGAALYVANCRSKREKVLTDSFPEVMDLLLVCIEAGLGLDAALSRVCKELRSIHPVVISELDRTRLELTMLGDRVVALQNLADRTGTVSFNTLVSSLIQTEKFGTSLVDTLRVLSEEQRVTRLFVVEQKAARMPVLITIPLILFIMPAFIMIILGPPLVRVANQGGLFGSEDAALR